MKKLGKVCVGIIIILEIITIVMEGIHLCSRDDQHIITSTTLKDAINISDLSTAKFIYNGIAEVYKDGEVIGYIKYNAEVKAGIDMNHVEFDVDEQKLTIRPILPEIKIQANIVDEKKLSFMPENIEIDLQDALRVCQDDAEREAKASNELFKVAQENLENTVEALIYPLIKDQGYSVIF